MTAARGERASAAAAQAPAGDADAAAATAAAAAAGPAAAAAAAAEAHHHAADAPAGPLDSAGSLAQGGDYHHHHANGGGAAAAAPPPPGGVVLLGHHQQHRHPHPHHRHHQHQHHAEPQTLGDISVRSGRSAASAASSKAPAGALHIEVADDEPPESVQAALEDAYQHPPARATRGAQARAFFRKMRGGLDHRLKVPHPTDLVFSWIGAFAGIAVVSLLDRLLWSAAHFPLLVASFGASAVLVYGVPESKLAQPWNFFGGQVLSSIIGVLVRLALASRVPWLANALGMSLALVAMQLTTTTHPPGGATALIACSAPFTAPWAGFQFVATVALGSAIMIAVALVTNNVCRDRAYPTYWW